MRKQCVPVAPSPPPPRLGKRLLSMLNLREGLSWTHYIKSVLFASKMPPNGPDEWRARIGLWENRKLRWYRAHCGCRPHVPLSLNLQRVISEAPLVCVLLLFWLLGKMATGVCETGNGTLSSLSKLTRCLAYGRRKRVWTTPLLSLFLALSLLLVVAGDVETNPGPISGEGKRLSFNVTHIHNDKMPPLFPQTNFLLKLMILSWVSLPGWSF